MENATHSVTGNQLFENFTRDGGEESFNALVQHYKLRLFNVAYGVLYDKHAAEDAVQTVFVTLFVQRNRLPDVQSPQSWLYRATLNHSIDMQKQTRRREDREKVMKPSLNSETPREAATRTELRTELDAALAKLKDSLRIPLMLRYMQDLSCEETSKTLGLSPNATRKRVHRGLKALRKLLVGRGLLVPVVAIEAGLRSIPAKAASANFLTSVSPIIKAASTASVAAKAAITSTSIVKGVTIMTAKGKIATGVVAAILVAGSITYFATRAPDKKHTVSPRKPLAGRAPRDLRPTRDGGARGEDEIPVQVIDTESNGFPEQAQEFGISGIVIDKVGNPIEGAKVQVFFYSWDDISLQRLESLAEAEPLEYETKEDGRFGFEYQEGKRYFLGAEKEDYVAVQENMDGPKQDIVLTMTLGGAIEGKVVDAATGVPLEHFRIVPSEDTRGGGLTLALFKKEVDIYLPTDGKEFNDPEGKFRVSGLSAGKYMLASIAEGYAQSYKGGIDVEVEKTTAGVLIKQEPGGGIRGHVVDAIGKPIESAEIVQKNPLHSTLFGEIGLPQRKALSTTNAKGEFEMDSLPEGTFTLQARHQNYCPAEQEVKVERGEVTENVEFQLVQGGVISGVVLAKVDLQPIADATVKLSTGSTFFGMLPGAAEAKTDQNGLFDLIKLEPGTYSLTVAAEDFADKTVEDLTLAENDAITDLIVELSQGGSLVGTVRDLAGKPIANRMIGAVGPGGTKMGQTDEQGKYAIMNMREGVYTAGAIEIGATPTMGPTRSDMHFVRIENDKETRLDIVVGGPRKVYGKVTLKGEPQKGLMVAIGFSPKTTAATKSQSQASDRTDEDGRYEMDNLQPGEYSLGVMKMAGMMPTPLFETEIDLTDTDLEKDIELPEGGISGKVVDAETRKPIEGARVALEQTEAKDIQSAAMSKLGMFVGGGENTDSEGKYSLSIVEDGAYYVVASKEGYAPQALTTEVRNSRGPSDLDFSLSSGATLFGQVAGSDPERRVKQIFLSANDADGRRVYSKKIGLSEEGVYEATGLAPGEYVISVDATGYASASRKVTVRSGSDNRADFVMSAGGTLIIKAVDERGNPVRGPQVEIMDEQGNFFMGFFPDLQELMNMGFEAIAREDGLHVSRNMPDGKYRVKVGALGYEDEFANVTVREGEETEETVTLRKSR
ncbi:sigma-70 family RNA polymerase sigma factor [bacterium]|nr:sigma-70 family RNA polymerase sigma factor [bacterium]